jgi:anti-sigma factor RsiW
MAILTTPAMTCRELVQVITDYLEGNLSRRDRRRFEWHIRGCDGCTTYVEQMRETIRLTGVLGEDDLPPAARDELLAVFRDWKGRSAS